MFHHLNEMGQLSNGFDWLCESLLSKFSMVQEKKQWPLPIFTMLVMGKFQIPNRDWINKTSLSVALDIKDKIKFSKKRVRLVMRFESL